MALRFVRTFLLPLVEGGALQVGRPLGPRRVEDLLAAWTPADGGVDTAAVPTPDEQDAAHALAEARSRIAAALVPDLPPPPLDAVTLRLGVILHNLLALTHPALQRADGLAARLRARTVAFTTELARLDAPTTLQDVVYRHTLLSRLAEITRPEHKVKYWLGQRTYVGTPLPSRLLLWPALRRVQVKSGQRRWLSEIGVPVEARPVWDLVQEASPLGEALEPLRLDPPPSWRRLPVVLRFAPLARLIAGRVLSLGLRDAGDALVGAFVRHATLRAPDKADTGPTGVSDGIRFFAHVFWLAHLGPGRDEPGPALAALLAAAVETDLGLVLPPDVSADGPVGGEFLRCLYALRARPEVAEAPHLKVARALCQTLDPGTTPHRRAQPKVFA